MSSEPAPHEDYDVVVIGGGPAGENAAQYAIQGSDRTAVLIESELVGGECSYWACMPSKALLRPIEAADAAHALPLTGDVHPDLVKTLQRRDDFTSHLDDSGQVKWAEGEGIHVLRGHARLSGERAVTITDAEGNQRTVRARHAVIVATGTTAVVPDIPGLRAAYPWTSRDATNLHEVPGRIAILGLGVVACEAATWLAALGADVTMIGRSDRPLERVEPFASELVLNGLRDKGVEVVLNASIESVSRPDARETGVGHVHGGPLTITYADRRAEVDEILVAAGRAPGTADLALDCVGVSTDHGYLRVDEHLTVPGHPWLYAVGDVNGKALLTHMGKYQGRIAGAVIAARASGQPLDGDEFRDLADDGIVPQVVFTTPQIAAVGLTSAQAPDARVVDYDLAQVAGASLEAEGYTGQARLVIDGDLIVGATFAGPQVAELVHAATIAIAGRVPLARLWHAVPSYPTVSEVWLRLLETARS
ncbi:dihydrolipoyl dehydrogenase family protein [Branchiibius cervicis]|uniref:Dihydrolipoyl dehydrogenase family protein n=1 Tax=Branchiibius cervicis TaxID=908252 RepID=A0ABW2AXL4_9MICO